MPTPEFDAAIEQVVFRPEWNVPFSIVRNEIVPRLRREPDCLQRAGFDVLGAGGVRQVATPVPADVVAGLSDGSLRLRQRPGSGNALGLVKLVAPNPYDVYLHDTPDRRRFDDARRALSHGCVRVDEIALLATWLLDDPVAWPPDRVEAAMSGLQTRTATVTRPARVRLVYLLAMVFPDGTVHFAEDAYRAGARDPDLAGGCPA